MEVAVRVMSRGQEIDRITRPLRMDGGRPAVTYRKLLWPVEDGCIHIETEHDATLYQGNTNLDEWVELVTRVLPESLPTHINDCTEVLRACFRENHASWRYTRIFFAGICWPRSLSDFPCKTRK